MLKTLIAVPLVLSVVILVHGQGATKIEARMVRGAFVGGDALHAIQEVALDLKAQATGPEDRVAVRVCSKEKLPIALLTATASPFVLREHLEHHGIEAQRILFLRSEDCLGGDPSIAVTEFWVVPKGAEPPASVESIRADRAQAQLVRAADEVKTRQDYADALQELLSKVSKRPEAVAVVVGLYYERPSALLVNNLRRARTVLLSGQGHASRVYVHTVRTSGIREGDEREPNYPNLYVFTAEPDAAQVPVRGRRRRATSGLGRLELYEGRLYEILPYEENAKGHCLTG